jgi:hypothetical protein
MRSISLGLLLCLSTILVAQSNGTDPKPVGSPQGPTTVTAKGKAAKPQALSCQPGTLTAYTNLPSSGGTWTATWTWYGTYCGSPILQTNASWMHPQNSGTSCSQSGSLYTCTTPYSVDANAGATRSGSLWVSLGSYGQDGPVTVTQFGPPQALSVNLTGGGSVSSSPGGISCPGICSAQFTYGTTVTLTASANAGYSFAGWSGACSGTGSCRITMYNPQSVTATFNAIPEALTVGVSGSGSVISSPAGISCPGICATSFPYGTTVYLSEVPSSGFGFSNWSGACSGASPVCTVTMSSNQSVNAIFQPLEVLTVTVSGGGTVTSSPSGISCPGVCSALFIYGKTVTLSASAVGGYNFAGWSGACSGTGTCTVGMSAAKAVSANFSPLIINTVAGNGTAGYTGDGGPATSAEFYGPVGVAVDASGNLYIADSGNCRVRKVTASTRIVSTVAGNGTCGYSGDGGPATNAEVYYPFGLAVDTAGNIYIADSNNNRVRKVTVATGIISTVAGNGTWGYSGDGGLATGATLAGVRDVAVDAAGNIYIGDGSHRVRKVTASTGIISTVAGNGTSGYSGDGGPATSAMLANVNGVAVDSAGNVYVADGYNQRIRKVTASTGIISTVAGSGPGGSDTGGSDSGGYSGDGGLATAAQLNFPADVAVDSAGNIYIADFWNFVVRKVVASTGIIYTASGNGMQGYSGDGGPAIAAEESSLISVAVDRLGNFYIAESAEMRVRAVTP